MMAASNPQSKYRKKWYGRCRICQKFKRLTKEHVPPASAFNDRAYREYYVEQTAEAELRQWASRDVNASGIFVFSLCAECNKKTGRAYSHAYADFVQAVSHVATIENADKDVEIELNNLYPARVVKQAVSMVLSTSNPDSFSRHKPAWNPFLTAPPLTPIGDIFGPQPDPRQLRSTYDELRRFVLKRAARGLPPSVRLYAYAVANPGSGVYTGILANATLSTKRFLWGAVVGRWPVHWLLSLAGESETPLLEVTDWAKADYRDKRRLKISVPCRWTVARYPLDFRSPEKFMRDSFKARMRYEGYLFDPDMDEEQQFLGALKFARRRGTITVQGHFFRQFKTGTYAEFKGHRLWFEGKRVKEVRAFLETPAAQEALLEADKVDERK